MVGTKKIKTLLWCNFENIYHFIHLKDINVAKLKMRSEKYIFKKKLSLKRKPKRRLFIESSFMFILSLFLVYISNLIPNKILLLQNIPNNLNKSFFLLIDLFLNLYEFFLLVFIFIIWIIALILLIGSFVRILKIMRR